MALILGVDPGSRKTGYGIIDDVKGKPCYVSSGVIRMGAELALPERLKVIFDSLCEIISHYQPQQFAIEQVFMAKNAGSALKLGQARGAAIVAACHFNIPVFEYEARKVKQAVVGTGAADKAQVQHMVKSLLSLSGTPQEDAADALAIAMCHSNTQQYMVRTARSLPGSSSNHKHFRRGRLI